MIKNMSSFSYRLGLRVRLKYFGLKGQMLNILTVEIKPCLMIIQYTLSTRDNLISYLLQRYTISYFNHVML